MAKKASCKHRRKTISLAEIEALFPDDATAEAWFVNRRWPSGVCCVKCGSVNIQERPTRKPQPYRCRDCRKDFSVKTGSVMHNSPLGFRTWARAVFLMTTNIKGIASTRLAEYLGITQKSAWFLAHRLRRSLAPRKRIFRGPIEVDEA